MKLTFTVRSVTFILLLLILLMTISFILKKEAEDQTKAQLNEEEINVTGVFDRIENGHAVILIEEHGTEILVPLAQLPPESSAGVLFTLQAGKSIKVVAIDTEATEKAKTTTNNLIRVLKQTKYKREKRNY